MMKPAHNAAPLYVGKHRKPEEPLEGPHSRACGILKHDHRLFGAAPRCHISCPTCTEAPNG